jgi:hypothetical protein
MDESYFCLVLTAFEQRESSLMSGCGYHKGRQIPLHYIKSTVLVQNLCRGFATMSAMHCTSYNQCQRLFMYRDSATRFSTLGFFHQTITPDSGAKSHMASYAPKKLR